MVLAAIASVIRSCSSATIALATFDRGERRRRRDRFATEAIGHQRGRRAIASA
jgi:hypothetical protein